MGTYTIFIFLNTIQSIVQIISLTINELLFINEQKCWIYRHTGITGPWTLMLDSHTGLSYWTLDSGHWTLDAGLWTLDARPWKLDAVLWTLDSRRWTLYSKNTKSAYRLHAILWNSNVRNTDIV